MFVSLTDMFCECLSTSVADVLCCRNTTVQSKCALAVAAFLADHEARNQVSDLDMCLLWSATLICNPYYRRLLTVVCYEGSCLAHATYIFFINFSECQI